MSFSNLVWVPRRRTLLVWFTLAGSRDLPGPRGGEGSSFPRSTASIPVMSAVPGVGHGRVKHLKIYRQHVLIASVFSA